MKLGRFLAIGIVAEKLTPAEAAGAIGIKTKTLTSIMRGGKCDGPTLVKILAWLTEPEDLPKHQITIPDIPLSGAPAARAHAKERQVSRGVMAS